MKTTLQDVINAYNKYYVIKDPYIIKILAGMLAANLILTKNECNNVWLQIIAVSSGGKTAMLAPLQKIGMIRMVDDLTPNTLLSGYGGKDASLLDQIGPLGMIIVSDLTVITSRNDNDVNQILAQFRNLYDGSMEKITGKGGLSWKGRMGFIAGGTPSMYHVMEKHRAQGERLLWYWLTQPTDEEIIAKKIKRNIGDEAINDEIGEVWLAYFKSLIAWERDNGKPAFELPKDQSEKLSFAAKFVVSAKAVVKVDWKGRVERTPDKAGPGRDVALMKGMLQGLHFCDCYERDTKDLVPLEENIPIVEKMAYSSINRERRKVLEILATSPQPLKASVIGFMHGLGLEEEPVNTYLSALGSVYLITKEINGAGSRTWTMTNQEYIDFVKRMSVLLDDNLPLPPSNRRPDVPSLEQQLASIGTQPKSEALDTIINKDSSDDELAAAKEAIARAELESSDDTFHPQW